MSRVTENQTLLEKVRNRACKNGKPRGECRPFIPPCYPIQVGIFDIVLDGRMHKGFHGFLFSR